MRTREPPAARRAAERTTQRAPAAQSAPATAALAARRRIHLALLSARAPMSASIALRRHGRSAGRPTGGEPRLHALQSVHREVAPHAPERAPHPGRRDGPRRLPGAPEDLCGGGLGLRPQTRSAQPQRARLASICRPVELVRLRTAQEVVVRELPRVSVLDRLPDEDEPRAARLPVRIHAGLVVIEAAPYLERVDGGDGLPAHLQAIETEPALRRQEGRHLAVEVLDGPARDAIRAPLRVPAQVMEAQEVPHGVGGLLGRGDDLDPIAGLPLQPAPPAQVGLASLEGGEVCGEGAREREAGACEARLDRHPHATRLERPAEGGDGGGAAGQVLQIEEVPALQAGRDGLGDGAAYGRPEARPEEEVERVGPGEPIREHAPAARAREPTLAGEHEQAGQAAASVARLQDPERPSLREGAPEGVLPLPGLEWVRRPASLVERVPRAALRESGTSSTRLAGRRTHSSPGSGSTPSGAPSRSDGRSGSWRRATEAAAWPACSCSPARVGSRAPAAGACSRTGSPGPTRSTSSSGRASGRPYAPPSPRPSRPACSAGTSSIWRTCPAAPPPSPPSAGRSRRVA